MTTRDPPESTISVPVETERTSAPRRISSRDLFKTSNELVIEHGAKEYRLRITSNGKLILTA